MTGNLTALHYLHVPERRLLLLQLPVGATSVLHGLTLSMRSAAGLVSRAGVCAQHAPPPHCAHGCCELQGTARLYRAHHCA